MGREMDWFIVELGLCFNGGSVTAATHNTTSEYRTRAFILWAIVDLCRLLKRCFVSLFQSSGTKATQTSGRASPKTAGTGPALSPLIHDLGFSVSYFIRRKMSFIWLNSKKQQVRFYMCFYQVIQERVFIFIHFSKGDILYHQMWVRPGPNLLETDLWSRQDI